MLINNLQVPSLIASTLLILNIIHLAHQAFGFLQLLLQEAHTLSQLLLAWQGILDSDVVVRGYSQWSGDAFE